MLSAVLAADTKGTIADFGAGAGAVAIATAHAVKSAHITAFEKDDVTDTEMSRDNQAEFNALVAAYRATYPKMVFQEALAEAQNVWNGLKERYAVML